MFNGKIYYFYGHFQLQTVSSPEGRLCLFFPGGLEDTLNGPRFFPAAPAAVASLVGPSTPATTSMASACFEAPGWGGSESHGPTAF